MLHYSSLQLACSRTMELETVKPGATIARQGAADCVLRIMLKGAAEAKSEEKPEPRALQVGDSVGFSCVLGASAEERLQPVTVVTTAACEFATLKRADFVHVNSEIGARENAGSDFSTFFSKFANTDPGPQWQN
jgi:hypothetical protein